MRHKEEVGQYVGLTMIVRVGVWTAMLSNRESEEQMKPKFIHFISAVFKQICNVCKR
jgi:hypothetical protein